MTRRSSLKALGLAGAALAAPAVLRAQTPVAVKCATATPGFTVVFYDLIRELKLDEKHGFSFSEPLLNASIASLFNALRESGGSDATAKDLVARIYKNVKVLDSGARGSTTTFVERGIGNVLILYSSRDTS